MPDAAMQLPASIAVGSFPTITQPGHVLGADAPAAEICSVSQCISAGPPDRITRWRHNRYCLFEDVAEAAAAMLDMCSSGGYEPGPYHLFEVYRARDRRVG